MNLIDQAKLFATQKHVLDNRQLYSNLLPYTHHLAAVEAVLVRFGFLEEEIRAAAWLHDVVEDTRDKTNEVKSRDIREVFGEGVAKLVEAVTSERGENRKVRNALTYPKIRAGGVLAVALKLADRIANVENGGGAVDMYKKEHTDFRFNVYIPYGADLPLGDASKVVKMQDHRDGLL
jgi:(p)ppGpp synthase/HD superfamily hydrolase